MPNKFEATASKVAKQERQQKSADFKRQAKAKDAGEGRGYKELQTGIKQAYVDGTTAATLSSINSGRGDLPKIDQQSALKVGKFLTQGDLVLSPDSKSLDKAIHDGGKAYQRKYVNDRINAEKNGYQR